MTFKIPVNFIHEVITYTVYSTVGFILISNRQNYFRHFLVSALQNAVIS